MAKLLCFSALLATLNFASALPPGGEPGAITRPKSYAALGDSFASGLGSGFPVDNDVVCQRQDGSYPEQLVKSGFFRDGLERFSNQACYNNGMEHLDVQIANLKGQRFDLVTLTVGHHNFKLEGLPTACVYQIRDPDIPKPQKFCDEALRISHREYFDIGKFEALAQRIEIIQDYVLSKDGQLFLTNYPVPFANPEREDLCDTMSFSPQDPALTMTYANRRFFNTIVFGLNHMLETVVLNFGYNVQLMDFNSLFKGKRFCEPERQDPIGADDPSVFLTDVRTTLKFPDFSPNPKELLFQNNLDEEFKHDLKRKSVFHPKAVAHRALAQHIANKLEHMIALDKIRNKKGT
ncbi:esterase [Diplocarpon rosae]|nr:esterase [Diplocarpon rosae]